MAVNIERSVVTVGKRAIIPEDVVNVAARDFQVVIEKVVLDEINEATAKQAFVQSEWPETGGHAAAAHAVDLPPESAREELHHAIVCLRAALFVRIIALLQPPPPASKYRTRVRAPILCYLTDMLNKGVYPTAALELVRHDQSDVQSRLMSLFFKDGPVFGSDQSLFQRRQCEELQITAPPPLSQQERELLCLGLPTFVTAVAALTLCSLRALLDTADAVASLSCEALQAHKKPFDSVYHEQSRPHKGEMRSLSNVRAMHEATKNLDARSAVKEQDPAFVCEFVSIHGTARTATDAALTAVQVDLNSVVVGPFGDGKDAPGPISAQPVIAATVGALSAFSGLLRFSNGRRTLVNSQVEDHQRLSPTASCAHAATTAVDSTATAAGTASSDLGFTDPAVFARALAPAITALLDPTSNDSNGVVAAFRATRLMHHCLVCECRSTLLAIDLRERVIVERQQQRLAAAEASGRGRGKAPPPAAAKSEAGGSAKGLGLGKGSEIVRSFLSQQLRGADRSALDRILDPLNPSFDFSAFLVNVFAGNAEHRLPKIPRGTRDFMPLQMNIREFAFNIITSVFKAHGAQTIDTPVFELKETLTGKYGEDSKLIYDLADQGGELLALRYDLTVPFARFVAMNKLERMKRYHISRVYRRDTPNPNKGRYREFFQCDFDIAGVYDPMVPDAEALKVLTEILTALPLGCNFIVKINHRKLLDAIMAVSGVPDHKFRTICSSIDKLDKEEWETVRREMVDEKGLSCAAAESIGRFVQRRGNPFQLLEALKQDSTLRSNESAMRAFDDLEKLFGYLERSYNVLHHFCFDLSLARGLDYYTGIIYEAVLTDSTSSLGSIAGGGRYDDLVGIFSPTGKKIPAVGVSIGIERIFDLMEKELIRSHRLRKSETEVLVGSIGTIPMEQRMMLCNQLWAEGIKAEHGYQAAHKDWRSQTEYMKERDIPFMICLSPEDSQKHAAQLKTLGQKETESVPLGPLVQRVRELVVEFRRNPVVTTQLEAPPSAVATATASTVATATASTAATATSSTATTASL